VGLQFADHAAVGKKAAKGGMKKPVKAILANLMDA
jgi:hypothetical protein